MNLAAGKGHLQVVQYLHENRGEGWTTRAMDWAAENGHTEVVKLLLEAGADVHAEGDWALRSAAY